MVKEDKNSFYAFHTGYGQCSTERRTDQSRNAAGLDITMQTLEQSGWPRTLHVGMIRYVTLLMSGRILCAA